MVPKLTQDDLATLYDRDFYLWIQTTVDRIRSGQFDGIDWDNVTEELESMGKRDKRELKNRTIVLIVHLLKWKYQSSRRSTSWRLTIREQRRQINDLLQDSPSLQPYLTNSFSQWYQNAREDAAEETQLPIATFPEVCPFSFDECLDLRFLPE